MILACYICKHGADTTAIYKLWKNKQAHVYVKIPEINVFKIFNFAFIIATNSKGLYKVALITLHLLNKTQHYSTIFSSCYVHQLTKENKLWLIGGHNKYFLKMDIRGILSTI